MANPIVSSTAQAGLNFMNTLYGEQAQAYGENQAALQAVQSAWAPVLQSGQIPFGYSPQLNSLLQSNVINTTGQATTNAINAAQLQERQASGGAPGAAPSGASDATNALIEAKGQQAEATGLQQEQIAGYQQGVQNLTSATQAELGVASGANEVGLAGAGTNAGALGLNAAEAQWQENQTSSPAAILGDIGQGISDATGIIGMAAGIPGIGGASKGPSSSADVGSLPTTGFQTFGNDFSMAPQQ